MKQDNTPKRSVKTVGTAFEIVETLNEVDEASLSELAERLDMPPSTLHTYLTTLQDLGYLLKDEGKYRLSLKFLDYGFQVLQNEPLYQVSGDFLEQVSRETREIAWVIVEEYGKAVCLRKSAGDQAIQPFKRIGARLHMHDIAAGKAILAELDDERVQEIIDMHGLPARTEHTITDSDELFEELEEIRETGIAFNDEENMEGFRAVASPIVAEGELYGSLVVSGPKKRIRDKRFREEFPEIISGTANALELELASQSD